MKYEIVELEEKTVVGLRARTSNNDPNMPRIIGELWKDYFSKGVYQSIKNKRNDKSIGLYTNYEGEHKDRYDVLVCCEIQKQSDIPMGVQIQSIPAGKYAKFIVKGNMQRAVVEFWTELWSMNLDREYGCDFEEYQSGGDVDQAEIHMYISLK